MSLTKGAAENTKHVARNPKVRAKRKQHQDKYQNSSKKNVKEVVKKYEHCSKRSTSTAANIMKVSSNKRETHTIYMYFLQYPHEECT